MIDRVKHARKPSGPNPNRKQLAASTARMAIQALVRLLARSAARQYAFSNGPDSSDPTKEPSLE